MSDVFVSYKAEDRRRVRPLVAALEADGYCVWWDEQIGGGASWRQAIETELNAAKCVIVAWSKRSVGPEGTFVQDEATRAQQRRVYVPVTIDKVHVPLGFGEMQALSLTGWKGDRSDPKYRAVLTAVARIAGGNLVEPAVRNVAHPPISRRAVLGGGAVAAAAAVGVGGWMLLKPDPVSASESIAVLPFANLSGDPAQAYFSDGIAEELRSALTRLAQLEVVGRTSSEAVRNDDAETAAKKLGVANILTGSVRQSPSAVRVSAQLIDGKSGMERWSDSYDRAPGDAIKIQTDIAKNVARALSAALGGAAGAALAVGGTKNAAAQNLVLQAGEAMDEGTRAGTVRAVQLVDQALRLDPDYADAYARKAIYMTRLGNAFATGAEELRRLRGEAFQIARKAVRLSPNSDRAHFALANLYTSYLQVGPAATEFRRALELAPTGAGLLRRYSYFIARVGSPSEALRIADKVVELDPLNPASYENRAFVLFDARRYGEALRYAEETKRRSPDMLDAPFLLANCHLMLGHQREALNQYSQLPADTWERLTGEALLLARAGDHASAERKVERMQQLFADAGSYQYGQIYVQLGDRSRALSALERGLAIKDAGLINIRIDELLDPLRGDTRFKSIIQRMRFPGV